MFIGDDTPEFPILAQPKRLRQFEKRPHGIEDAVLLRSFAQTGTEQEIRRRQPVNEENPDFPDYTD